MQNDTGHDNQAEAEQKAALIAEITAVFDRLPSEDLKRMHNALILLFDGKNSQKCADCILFC
jgi:DNA topoisomerase VI subunit A